MALDFKIDERSSISVVTLSGELIDKHSADDLVAATNNLLDSNKSKIVFDLHDLRYMNSSGLTLMINILTRARKAGGEVVIANVSKKVKDLLIITKLNTVFTVTDSVDNALKKLS